MLGATDGPRVAGFRTCSESFRGSHWSAIVMDVDASEAPHGLMPLQAAGAPKPFQVRRPDFAPIPRERALCDPEKNLSRFLEPVYHGFEVNSLDRTGPTPCPT